ncbi:ACP S-malonyltransferase [Kineosporia mesophila]|uniref:[acyl-carrier-protein] S-malonyltransferase n=1 Tax=Kineosporia mesophila TaxID=566012 RepID=A0ABP6Z7A2_9ACTN|nr:hypothetical protein [Kineosporia mesophila]MCD5352935.1 hypothetical protein [Kineosporia mesophila]
MTLTETTARPGDQSPQIVGFFPGLGSRSHHRDLDRDHLDANDAVTNDIYRSAATVLGFPATPERLLLRAGDLPPTRLAQQSLIGAGVLVHGLVLRARLIGQARHQGLPAQFVAYTGESFGMLTAAVAAGALSVTDGVRTAAAFTPLLLMAAEGAQPEDDFTERLARYRPGPAGSGLVAEPHHVIGLRGAPEVLEHVLEQARAEFGPDVELHKAYSWRQVNVYVPVPARDAFDRFTGRFPELQVTDLKPPTRFLAHSARMRPARAAFERFLNEEGITLSAPSVPLVPNHGTGLIRTADEVREALGAMVDQVMDSRSTVEMLQQIGPDLVVEFGPGARSLHLLADNHVPFPSTAYTGAAEETAELLEGLELSAILRRELRHRAGPGPLDPVRRLFRATARSAFLDGWVRHTVNQVVADELLTDAHAPLPGTVDHRLLAVLQHTLAYRDVVDLRRGEIVLQARLKRDVFGQIHGVGRPYSELQVSLPDGETELRTTSRVLHPEVVVHLLDAPGHRAGDGHLLGSVLRQEPPAREQVHAVLAAAGLNDDVLHAGGARAGAARRLLLPLALFRTLGRHRPALLAQTDHYLAALGREGWLAALVLAGSADSASALAVTAGADVEAFVAGLGDAQTPLLAPSGTPVRSGRDLRAVTRGILRPEGGNSGPLPVRLNGDCLVISLGHPITPEDVDARPFRGQTLAVTDPHDIARRGTCPDLDDFENRVLRSVTAESRSVLREARQRRVLISSVNTFLAPGESVLGFGDGGSESLTIFLERPGEKDTVVRKILSPALITARWEDDGTGVMLPPFAKARKQAEFLQALPEPVRSRFPRVTHAQERVVPVPEHLREGRPDTFTEMVYEMSYVPGVEVSRYVARETPPPAVVARLYEVIFSTLHRETHTVGRVPAPGSTLETSYFRKIEDRLNLCRRTAPLTFSPDLLDTEHIVINGRRYLNHGPLLRRFRQNAVFRRVLEPRWHALVMGDTNTENIKMAQVEPLRRAARLIADQASPARIAAALHDITAGSIGLMFLDPRAIGFDSDGAVTRDDPMYDNKPWHNSIGHYDEMHHEHFDLVVDAGPGRTPSIDVAFHDDNPYRRSYRVRDVAVTGAPVHPHAPEGMEDHFAAVMTSAHGLDRPGSSYLREDPHWLVRFVFMMGTHFTAMPPFHFSSEPDGSLSDSPQSQRRPVAIYGEGVQWLNWALELLEGTRTQFLGVCPAALPGETGHLADPAAA